MADVEQHKTCPFCGGQPTLVFVDIQDLSVDYPMRRIGCMQCLTQGPLGKNDIEAWAKWDVRTNGGLR